MSFPCHSYSVPHAIQSSQRVAQATYSVLGTTSNAALEVLNIGADSPSFAPIAELVEAAKVLLKTWDSLQMVDVSADMFHFFLCSEDVLFLVLFTFCPFTRHCLYCHNYNR
jgi:hypothetical protein